MNSRLTAQVATPASLQRATVAALALAALVIPCTCERERRQGRWRTCGRQPAARSPSRAAIGRTAGRASAEGRRPDPDPGRRWRSTGSADFSFDSKRPVDAINVKMGDGNDLRLASTTRANGFVHGRSEHGRLNSDNDRGRRWQRHAAGRAESARRATHQPGRDVQGRRRQRHDRRRQGKRHCLPRRRERHLPLGSGRGQRRDRGPGTGANTMLFNGASPGRTTSTLSPNGGRLDFLPRPQREVIATMVTYPSRSLTSSAPAGAHTAPRQ